VFIGGEGARGAGAYSFYFPITNDDVNLFRAIINPEKYSEWTVQTPNAKPEKKRNDSPELTPERLRSGGEPSENGRRWWKPDAAISQRRKQSARA
jgi:hypothetical protein